MSAVSVVIPTYNRAELLKQAVQNVLDQTYQDFEIIVVDDASSSGEAEKIIKSFNDKRMRYVRHSENKGAAAARNTGIKISNSRYIAFKDDDDVWHTEYLKKTMAAFETATPETGVVYAKLARIESGQEKYIPWEAIIKREGSLYQVLLQRNFIGTTNAVFKKECFDKAGMFDENLRALEDWECWIRISKYFEFRYIDELLGKSYVQVHGVSSNKKNYINAVIYILKKHFEDIKKDKKLLSSYYAYIGLFLFRIGDRSRGMPYFFKSLTAAPLLFLARLAKRIINFNFK